MLDDTSGGVTGMSQHHHRLREVSVQSMVEMTARQRMDRALTSKTRQSHQQLALEVNDTVDFHRPTATKEESGWRGPARLVEIGPPAIIKWQDRFMQVRTQDIRRALHYAVFYTMTTTSVAYSMYGDGQLRRPEDPVEIVTSFADNLDGAVIRLGWLLQKDRHRAESNSKLSELLLAVLHVASCGLYLKGCIGARIGGGVSVLEGIAEC